MPRITITNTDSNKWCREEKLSSGLLIHRLNAATCFWEQSQSWGVDSWLQCGRITRDHERYTKDSRVSSWNGIYEEC